MGVRSMIKNKTILVTGAAGFIGHHLAALLLARGDRVIGLDNLNSYYDVNLKLARLEQLKKFPNFSFEKIDLVEKEKINDLFKSYFITHVAHLAAQAGVRYSIENPDIYVSSNVVGFINILECCRHHQGKMCCGRTPMQTFLDGKKICEEKVINSNLN